MSRPTRQSGNLPAETSSFIGRHRELAEVRARLAQARMVCLAGPGGVGKTRLAMRAATDLRRGFRDGGWLVELADIVDPGLVSNAVMAGLDLRDQAGTDPSTQVLSFLRDKELLLVVDNCEHLLAAAAGVIAEIMKTAPGVRVLATSREPLSVPGEHVVPVPPLELPSPDADQTLAQLSRSEAVMLFSERAAAASGTFELTTANQAAVVDLCRRLDGLPLAIELAAVRTRFLTVEQILDRLADRFSLLTGGSRGALPRHRTLRTTIEWSHDLLSDAERAVLRRCFVFTGRFTLDDAESVCAFQDVPAAQALDLLASLVDKSLVVKEDVDVVASYRLHETMREYAGVKLSEASEETAAWERYTEHYRSRCRRWAQDRRYQLADWLPWADLEIDNIRALLWRCLDGGGPPSADAACGIEVAASASWYWITRATTEGTRWLDEFLPSGAGDPRTRGRAYFLRGFLALLKADPAAAGPALHAAAELARQAGHGLLLAEALSMASIVADLTGDQPSATRMLDEAHAVAAGIETAWPAAALAVLQARALRAFLAADIGQARSAAAQGVRLARDTGDLYGLEMMLLNQGAAARLAGDLDESGPLLTEALQIAGQIDDRLAQWYLLDELGCLAASRRQARLAARLFGAADTLRTEAGGTMMPFHAPPIVQAREASIAALGATRFEAEFGAGKVLDRDAALRLALGQPDHAPAGSASTGPLGQREADVARLVAQGLTNKQIGARLFISERTVDSHVRNILNKLGFDSRTQIAAWMAASGQ
jgi:predicted ATPase/DNA-binding CsgD family transcriptional regulator